MQWRLGRVIARSMGLFFLLGYFGLLVFGVTGEDGEEVARHLPQEAP
jgi:hypothetical protein